MELLDRAVKKKDKEDIGLETVHSRKENVCGGVRGRALMSLASKIWVGGGREEWLRV